MSPLNVSILMKLNSSVFNVWLETIYPTLITIIETKSVVPMDSSTIWKLTSAKPFQALKIIQILILFMMPSVIKSNSISKNASNVKLDMFYTMKIRSVSQYLQTAKNSIQLEKSVWNAILLLI